MKVSDADSPHENPAKGDVWRRTDGAWFMWDGDQWYALRPENRPQPPRYVVANTATGIAAKGATPAEAEANFSRALDEYRDQLAAEEDGLHSTTAKLLADLRAGRIKADVHEAIR